MAATATLRDDLKSAIGDTVTTLTVHDTWPGSITPPAALIAPVGREHLNLTGDIQSETFEVTVLVGAGEMAAAQDALDGYFSSTGSGSVEAAIRASAVNWLSISARDYGFLEVGGITYWGFVLEVRMLTG